MPRNLFLHIGTAKTGSTTIQHLLNKSRPALLEQGFCYPGQLINHLTMAMQFSTETVYYENFDSRVWHGKDPHVHMAEQQESFRQEMLSLPAGVDRVILSSESFSQFIREPADIARFAAMLKEFFDKVTVLVYLRRQDGHYASMHSQDLRRGMIRRPRFDTPKAEKDLYDYERLLNNWASAFGAANIKPRIFERDTNKSFDVVTDFMAQVGLDTLPVSKDAVKTNPSMNLAGQRILREIGRSLMEHNAKELGTSTLWKRLNSAVTMALPGSGWRPTQDEGRAFVAKFEATNEAVRKAWFPERSTLFSTDFSHLPVEELKTNKRDDARAAYDVILYLLRQELAQEQEASTKKVEGTTRGDKRRSALLANVHRDPKSVSARLDLAEFQVGEGAVKAARHNIKRALKVAPEDERALAMLESLPADEDEAETAPRPRPGIEKRARFKEMALAAQSRPSVEKVD
jgi:hypothetical protein